MLLQKLIGASAPSGLTFVGGTALSSGSATSTPSFSLTGLTGGLSSAPSIGDIVIACVAFKDATNRNIQCTTAGYTEIADLYSDSTNDSQLGIYRKVLTAADTSIAFNIAASVFSRFVCHVWRNINATPLDAPSEPDTIIGGPPNALSITTVTNRAVVIAIGAQAGGASSFILSTPTVPSGMENFYRVVDNTDSALAIASVLVSTAGTYDPAAFGGFSTNNGNGSCVATLALRPV